MASYGRKFQWTFQYPGGASVELVISAKNYSGTVFDIGALQGLSLEIGGGTAAVYEPVVKTILRFTLVDAWDKGQAWQGENAVIRRRSAGSYAYTKFGQWEQFYTNDPTQFKVELKYASATIWSGFITPDSWQEEMYYHGSLTIIARDMLGTLEDKPFDATGNNSSISVINLIEQAVIKSEAAMSVNSEAADNLYHIGSNGADQSILSALLQVSAFEGKTWWDALTSVLESLGMVLKYTGSNGWKVTSLRYLSSFAGSAHDCEFVNRTGMRELQPPVRDISGTFVVDLLQISTEAVDERKYSDYGDAHVVDDSLSPVAISTWTYPVQALTQDSGKWGATAGTGDRPPLFVKAMPPRDGQFDLSSSPYLLCNTGRMLSLGLSYQKDYGYAIVGSFTQAPCKLTIAQDGALVYAGVSDFALPRSENFGSTPVELKSVLVYISSGGSYYQGEGVWNAGTEKSSDHDTVGTIDPLKLDFEGGVAQIDIFASSDIPENITVNIVRLVTSGHTTFQDGTLCAPIRVTMSEIGGGTLPTENFVKLEYNEGYNVSINRTPTVGSVDTNYPPALIPNVLSYNGRALSNEWGWSGDSQGYPLEVLVQMQMLVYYAATSSLFSGTLRDKSAVIAIPGNHYGYYALDCMMLRGTFDFTTGWINGISMLEFRSWSEVWTSPPTWASKGTRGSGGGGGNGIGGASPISGGGSGNITELTERVEALESLIGEDANRDAYVKPYTTYEEPEQEGDDPTPVQHTREFKNAGGAHVRDITLKSKVSPSASAHLEVLRIASGHSVVEVLHSRLPIVSEGAIVAGGAWSGGGGGGGGSSVTWGNDQQTQGANYETLNVDGSTRVVALKGHAHPISEVTGLSAIIPSGTGAGNPLVNQSQMDDAIATSSGTYRGQYNSVADLPTTGVSRNDYAIVVSTSGGNTVYTRYKYDGSAWMEEYTINNSSFSTAQWNAINSGITSALVLLIPDAHTQAGWSAKQDALTFDNSPTQNSNNPVKSGGIYTALAGKVDAENGKGLSTNDFTDGYKNTLDNLSSNYVTVSGAAQSISSQKTFTSRVIANAGVEIPSGNVGIYLRNSNDNASYNALELSSWKDSSDKVNLLVCPHPSVVTGYAILGVTDKEWGALYLKASGGGINAGSVRRIKFASSGYHITLTGNTQLEGNLAPDGNGTRVLGSDSLHWDKVYARGLYPLGDSGDRLVYNASDSRFEIYGDLVVSGAVVAGGVGSSSGGGGTSVVWGTVSNHYRPLIVEGYDGEAAALHTVALQGHGHSASDISGLATVATTGSYNDLSNRPTIPTHLGDLSETTTGTGSWHLTTASKNLLDSLAHFDEMFERVGSGTSADPYLIHALLPLYSDGAIVAGGTGSGSGGGGGTSVVWGMALNYYRPLIVEGYEQESAALHTVALQGHGHSASDISGLATVATSGSYTDLSNKPSIPTKLADLTGNISWLDDGDDANDLYSGTWLWANNTTPTPVAIDNTPAYGGSLTSFGKNGNYGPAQLAVSSVGDLYWRILWGNDWKSWKTAVTVESNQTISGQKSFSSAVRPATDADTTPIDLGTSSLHWDKVYARGLYPAGASGIRMEYDASIGGFKITGNLVVTGAVVAGGTLPSNS